MPDIEGTKDTCTERIRGEGTMLGVFKVFNPGQPAVASAILYTLSKADVFLNLFSGLQNVDNNTYPPIPSLDGSQ